MVDLGAIARAGREDTGDVNRARPRRVVVPLASLLLSSVADSVAVVAPLLLLRCRKSLVVFKSKSTIRLYGWVRS